MRVRHSPPSREAWSRASKAEGRAALETSASRSRQRRSSVRRACSRAIPAAWRLAAALAAFKPHIALYVGGMGAQEKNFHKDAMAARGYAAEAGRIQELYLAGRKDEAAAAVPGSYLDEGALIGSPARIAERFARWRKAGFTLLRVSNPEIAAMEVLAAIARKG